MDQCSGQFIIKMRAATLSMENSIGRMEKYRAATLAACALVTPCPEAITAFQAVSKIEFGIQNATRIFWNEQKAIWEHALSSYCHLTPPIRSSHFPEFDFPMISGSAADLVPRPPHLIPNRELSLHTSKLVSAAKLERKLQHDWAIRWTE